MKTLDHIELFDLLDDNIVLAEPHHANRMYEAARIISDYTKSQTSHGIYKLWITRDFINDGIFCIKWHDDHHERQRYIVDYVKWTITHLPGRMNA